MNILLDTHALIWWLEASDRLSPHARAVIAENAATAFASAATAWEMATKFRLGKLPGVAPWVDDLRGCIEGEGSLSPMSPSNTPSARA